MAKKNKNPIGPPLWSRSCYHHVVHTQTDTCTCEHTLHWRVLFTQTSDQHDPRDPQEWLPLPSLCLYSPPSLCTSSLPPSPLTPLGDKSAIWRFTCLSQDCPRGFQACLKHSFQITESNSVYMLGRRVMLDFAQRNPSMKCRSVCLLPAVLSFPIGETVCFPICLTWNVQNVSGFSSASSSCSGCCGLNSMLTSLSASFIILRMDMLWCFAAQLLPVLVGCRGLLGENQRERGWRTVSICFESTILMKLQESCFPPGSNRFIEGLWGKVKGLWGQWDLMFSAQLGSPWLNSCSKAHVFTIISALPHPSAAPRGWALPRGGPELTPTFSRSQWHSALKLFDVGNTIEHKHWCGSITC